MRTRTHATERDWISLLYRYVPVLLGSFELRGKLLPQAAGGFRHRYDRKLREMSSDSRWAPITDVCDHSTTENDVGKFNP